MKRFIKRACATILTISICLVDLHIVSPLVAFADGTSWNFSYTGNVQTFKAPSTGRYYIEMYGASGGGASSSLGGTGGYTTGYYDMRAGDTLNIVVGGQGTLRNGGYNGGGNSDSSNGGGGCTFVAIQDKSVNGTITNYKEHEDLIILAAGGGGGVGSRINTHFQSTGNGGGLNQGAHSCYANTTTYDAEANNYKTFGQGGQGRNGGGGGGGGILGGPGFNGSIPGNRDTIGGGFGGSGYIGMYASNAVSSSSSHIGNGSVHIEYQGKIETSVIIDFGSGATSNGKSTITLNGYADETIDINYIVKSGYTFSEFNRKYGDALINNNKLTFGIKNSAFDVLYLGQLTLKTHINDDKMNFEFIENDDYTKYYRLYESLDGNSYQYVDAGSENQTDINKTATFTYKGYVESFRIPFSAPYSLDIYGGCGGGSLCQGHYEAANGYGGHTWGTKWLEIGDILYIAIGGNGGNGNRGYANGGWNGGGSGSPDGKDNEGAGGGGGASHIALNSNRGLLSAYNLYRNEIVCVAGGGGGREYSYSSGLGGGTQGGDSHGYVATQTTGYAFGYGQNGSGSGDDSDGVGGGGGGWYGGYATYQHGCGGGGGSGYIGGLDTGYTTTSSHTGAGTCTISYLDRRISDASLDDIPAKDLANPNMPSEGVVEGFSKDVLITWKNNGDNGTTYYHKVESYNNDTGERLNVSNVTKDLVISGVKGFYYKFNNNVTDVVTQQNNDGFTENNFVNYDTTKRNKYIHVATVDYAGNISSTYSFEIPLCVIITFNKNDTVYNIYGDKCTSNALGDMPDQIIPYESSENLNKIAFDKKGYKFVNWNTQSDGSGTTLQDEQLVEYYDLIDNYGYNITLYAQWKPIEYDIVYYGTDNWNKEQSVYSQHQIYDKIPFALIDNKYNRDIHEKYDKYNFVGWSDTKDSWTKKYNNKQTITENLTYIDGDKINLYAIWEKPLNLTFKLNGGQYQGNSDDIALSTKIYNMQYNYDFNIVNGTVEQKDNYFLAQNGKIDAYGLFDSNGENSKYIRYDDNGNTYRFLGWSTEPDATEPDNSIVVYDSNHVKKYNIYNDEILYAVWEPVLIVNLSMLRTLGTLSFSDGTFPVQDVKSKRCSDGTQYIELIARSGDQCSYSISTKGKDGINAGIRFDNAMLKIYQEPDKSWYDNLNSNTGSGEEVESYCGLNRDFTLNENYLTRKFYIPQYLGTNQSPDDSKGRTNYFVIFEIAQKSYFYDKYAEGAPRNEQIEVDGTIYLSTRKTNTDSDDSTDVTHKEPVISVLDELRAKLKIRLK